MIKSPRFTSFTMLSLKEREKKQLSINLVLYGVRKLPQCPIYFFQSEKHAKKRRLANSNCPAVIISSNKNISSKKRKSFQEQHHTLNAQVYTIITTQRNPSPLQNMSEVNPWFIQLFVHKTKKRLGINLDRGRWNGKIKHLKMIISV